MLTQLNELKFAAKDNANNHHWKIFWTIKEYQENLKNYKSLTVGDALALCHSELSEALEAHRNDDKKHFSEEIADEFIRLLHLCGDLDIDIEKAIYAKMLKNTQRPINHGRKNY